MNISAAQQKYRPRGRNHERYDAGCSVDTVKTRMFHARRRLNVLLVDREEAAA
jgi:hypothetical protein